MEILWRVMVNCIADNKRMEPIGEYIPAKSNVARFIIGNRRMHRALYHLQQVLPPQAR